MNLSPSQLKRVVDDIFGYCTRCPRPAMNSSISRTVDDFCKAIGGVRHELGPISANPDTHPDGVYTVVAPFAGLVFNVVGVEIDGEQLARWNYRASIENGRARIFIPTAAKGAMRIRFTWIPSSRTSQMPEAWFDANFDAICHGSIAKILSQVGTAWANPALAQQMDEDFSRAVCDAIRDNRSSENGGGVISALDRTERWL